MLMHLDVVMTHRSERKTDDWVAALTIMLIIILNTLGKA